MMIKRACGVPSHPRKGPGDERLVPVHALQAFESTLNFRVLVLTQPSEKRMKKSLFGLVALATVGTAAAQSSVTVFGHVDLNVTYSKAGNESRTGMDQGGYLLPSRLGFRGTEDLGEGISASFWLESAVLPDTGATQGDMWMRRSTVSLTSKDLGELRLGRDYTAAFWNVSTFSPFGTVGVGGVSNIIEGWPAGLGDAVTLQRASNMLAYFLPKDLGGFYGQLNYALDEDVEGRGYAGGRVGYESGPLNIAVAFGRTSVGPDNYKTATIGGTYDFDVIKAYVNYLQHQLGSDKQRNALIGATVPVGRGQVKLSYARSDRSGPFAGDDAQQASIGYVHVLTKRTILYSAYSYIKNEGNAAYVISDSSPEGQPGEKSSGLQFGISHDF